MKKKDVKCAKKKYVKPAIKFEEEITFETQWSAPTPGRIRRKRTHSPD